MSVIHSQRFQARTNAFALSIISDTVLQVGHKCQGET